MSSIDSTLQMLESVDISLRKATSSTDIFTSAYEKMLSTLGKQVNVGVFNRMSKSAENAMDNIERKVLSVNKAMSDLAKSSDDVAEKMQKISKIKEKINEKADTGKRIEKKVKRKASRKARRAEIAANKIRERNSIEKNVLDKAAGQTSEKVKEAEIKTSEVKEKTSEKTNIGKAVANKVKSDFEYILSGINVVDVLGSVMNFADDMANINANLEVNLIPNDGNLSDVKREIASISQEIGSSFAQTANTVAQLGKNSRNAFQTNEEMILFTEQLNKQFGLTGLSSKEASEATERFASSLSNGKINSGAFSSLSREMPGIISVFSEYMKLPQEEIRKMGEAGEITAENLKNALFTTADETNQKFSQLPMTFSKIGTNMQTSLISTFMPVVDMMAQAAQFISENWSTIEPIFWGLAAAVGAYAIAANWATVSTAILSAWIWIANGAALTFFATLLKNPITWIALAVGLLVMAIVKWIQSVGGVHIAWLMLTDFILTSWGEIKYIPAKFWHGLCELWSAIQNLVWRMDYVILKIIENILNAFINMINKITKIPIIKAKFDFAEKYKLENEGKENIRKWELSSQGFDISEKERALEKAHQKRLDKIKKQQEEAEKKEDKYDVDKYIQDKKSKDDTTPYVPTNNNVANNIANIDDNTTAIKESASISSENLKYLRELASQEIINRFTTAEIKVDMVNNNKVSSKLDLDGIANYLKNKVVEEMYASAEGVYV